MEASTFEPMTEPMTEPMRRVMDALVEGVPAPPDAQAALTDAERAHVAALARTVHLARLTLQKPEPPPEAEAASLGRAQAVLENRPPYAVALKPESPAPPPARSGGGGGWLRRLFHRSDK